VKADQIDIFTASVFCDFEQVEHAEETGFACQFWGDIREADSFDGVDFDGSFLTSVFVSTNPEPRFHGVSLADGDARAQPKADGARDFAAANAIAKAFGEDHEGLR